MNNMQFPKKWIYISEYEKSYELTKEYIGIKNFNITKNRIVITCTNCQKCYNFNESIFLFFIVKFLTN